MGWSYTYLQSAFGILAASAAMSEELCYKQPGWGPPMTAENRLCRLNMIFEEWLTENGYETASELSTYEKIERINGSMLETGWFLPLEPNRPWVMINVAYDLGWDEALEAGREIKFRPNLFHDLERVLRQQARAIICETKGDGSWLGSEDGFASSGGEIVYSVGLRPRLISSSVPDWFVKVEIPQSSCEVN